MEFESFVLSRDLLCLAGALTGATAGYVASLGRGDTTIRARNRLITIALVVFSAALAAFAGAIIVSKAAIFDEALLFAAPALCVPVFALAFRFPRAAGYPLILAGGLLAVWLGYSFLRYPLVKNDGIPLAALQNDGARGCLLRLPAGPADAALSIVLPLPETGSSVELRAVFVGVNRFYPLIGGEGRGFVSLVRRGGETLYAEPGFQGRAGAWYRYLDALQKKRDVGITFRESQNTADTDAIPQGTVRVFIDGEGLVVGSSRAP
ncbi:MAG: hypothetical protein LBS06_03555 [Treponema sp.]|jgi:hypothetical protein|nr:hypothetical protein [Treponema sp.]